MKDQVFMTDLLFLAEFSLDLLLLILFIIMTVMYLYQSKNTVLENNFFLICMVFGTFAMIFFVIDTLSYQLYHNVMLRVRLETLTFSFFGLYFYFFYRHYQSITDTTPYTWPNMLSAYLVIANICLTILFFLGIPPPNLSDIGLNIPSNQVIVTYVSFITFIIGVLSSGFALYTIIRNNLIEIHKCTIFELISIIILFCDNIFLIINDILVTYNVYNLAWSYTIVTSAIFIYIIGLALFIVNNILFLPPHIYTPSLLYNKYKELDLIFSRDKSNENITSKEQSLDKMDAITGEKPVRISTHLNYASLINESGISREQTNQIAVLLSNTKEKDLNDHKELLRADNLLTVKLTTTAIEILIYLLKSVHDSSYANKIEKDLKLKKNTVSYNLGILEANFLIDPRKIDIESDVRYKQIRISNRGINYLNALYKSLKDFFE